MSTHKHSYPAELVTYILTHMSCREGDDAQREDGQPPDATGPHDAGGPHVLSHRSAARRMSELL